MLWLTLFVLPDKILDRFYRFENETLGLRTAFASFDALVARPGFATLHSVSLGSQFSCSSSTFGL